MCHWFDVIKGAAKIIFYLYIIILCFIRQGILRAPVMAPSCKRYYGSNTVKLQAVYRMVYNTALKRPLRNSLKRRWRRWKCAQNAHVLRVHSAFSHISALPSSIWSNSSEVS